MQGSRTKHEEASRDDPVSILRRLNTAAQHSRLVETALRNASTLNGGSRSEGPLGLGAALKHAGWSYADMKATLLACPATKEWANEKLAEGERQFERIWNRATDEEHDEETATSNTIANPLGIWDAGDDDYAIEPRGWLLGNTFCRKFLSSLIADGGVGKTAVRIAQLISLAVGRSLTGEHVFLRCRVLILSLEDDRDELRRRVYAAMLKYGIKPAEVKGWLFLAAPKNLKLAAMVEGSPQASQLEGMIRSEVTARKLDIVSLARV